MRLRILFATLLVASITAANAVAGPVYLSLILNPPTDADAASTLDGTSTQSGLGTYHLYAFDDTTGSQGIAAYSVTLSNINTILNRSPSTLWNDGDADHDAGFRLLRSANDTTAPVGATSNPVTGAQPLVGSTPISPITGFGRQSSDFATKIPGATGFSSQTSPSWGDYATDPPSNPLLTGLFLAEGTYTVGNAPAITAARIQLYDANFAVIEGEEVFGDPPAGVVNTPPTVVSPAPAAGVSQGQVLLGDFNATDTETPAGPFTFSGLALSSFVPLFPGAVNPAFNTAASIDPATGVVTFDTTGFARGSYLIQATVTDPGGLTAIAPGQWSVTITQVPEPSTLALFGLAMVGMVGMARRRNG